MDGPLQQESRHVIPGGFSTGLSDDAKPYSWHVDGKAPWSMAERLIMAVGAGIVVTTLATVAVMNNGGKGRK